MDGGVLGFQGTRLLCLQWRRGLLLWDQSMAYFQAVTAYQMGKRLSVAKLHGSHQ